MNALAERTIEVMPLGRRGRYSLTPEQQRAYIALVAFIDDMGRSPSLFEWSVEIDHMKGQRITELRNSLEERGWISVERMRDGVASDFGITLLEPVLRDLVPHKDTLQ